MLNECSKMYPLQKKGTAPVDKLHPLLANRNLDTYQNEPFEI